MIVTPAPSWAARSVISAVVIPVVVSMPLILMAQEAIAPYCSDLKRVADLAMTNERFASISVKPRDGNFSDSNLALTGWNDCSVYGARIYTCDTQPTGTAQEATTIETNARLAADRRREIAATCLALCSFDQHGSASLSLDIG